MKSTCKYTIFILSFDKHFNKVSTSKQLAWIPKNFLIVTYTIIRKFTRIKIKNILKIFFSKAQTFTEPSSVGSEQ